MAPGKQPGQLKANKPLIFQDSAELQKRALDLAPPRGQLPELREQERQHEASATVKSHKDVNDNGEAKTKQKF